MLCTCWCLKNLASGLPDSVILLFLKSFVSNLLNAKLASDYFYFKRKTTSVSMLDHSLLGTIQRSDTVETLTCVVQGELDNTRESNAAERNSGAVTKQFKGRKK